MRISLVRIFDELGLDLHPFLGSCFFLGLAKICMNQIRSTSVISNQKRLSEGIPLIM